MDKSLEGNNHSENKVKRTKIVVGLDIGTTKIACFVGKKNEHGKIEILSMGKSESLGVMSGVVSNIKQTIESIKLAIQETQSRVEGDLIIKGMIRIMIIPDIESINFGRGVGYDVIEHIPPAEIGEISATKIREANGK